MNKHRWALGAMAALLIAMLVAVPAIAGKGGPGSSEGTGLVFYPNPVAYLGDQTLTDQKDADYAALQAAYVEVTLTNLDGSGYLVGDWANVLSETGDRAYAPDGVFRYHRDDDRFEQVMTYFWITEAQKYIQSLGFGSKYRPINMESQDVRINQWGQDNSYSWDKKDVIRLGKGGVDDAEDAEVILHEYGHAIQGAQSTPFGAFGSSIEAGAIGEGFGDYFAASVTDVIAPTDDPACVADWDATSYDPEAPYCLHRVDTNLHYPEDLRGRVHYDGQLWSCALWDIRGALGHVKADTIILESQFSYKADTTMPLAAEEVVKAAQRLYGTTEANAVRKAFVDRGILK